MKKMKKRKKLQKMRGFTYLHDFFDPSSLVIVFEADDGGVRGVEVSIEQDEMISEHEEEASWDQEQVKGFLLEQHHSLFCYCHKTCERSIRRRRVLIFNFW